jgi:hypothetical protein
MKYAIKIPFGNPEDKSSWIYVTDAHSADFDDVKVKIFDNIDSANRAAKVWRLHEIVEYTDTETAK